MEYELAKKLKDAGFPQREELLVSANDAVDHDLRPLSCRETGYHRTYDSSRGESLEELRSKPVSEWEGKARASIYMSAEYLNSDEGKELTVYQPTLSELIDACGEAYPFLFKNKDTWYALCGVHIIQVSQLASLGELSYIARSERGSASTPEEAVANLWLALNTK